MSAKPSSSNRYDTRQSQQFHRRRLIQDRLARLAVRGGGLLVLGFMMLILLYLVWVVVPLFGGARVEQQLLDTHGPWAQDTTVLLAIEEQSELGLRLGQDGGADFFSLDGFELVRQQSIVADAATQIAAVARNAQSPELIAVGFDNGEVDVLKQQYSVVYSGDVTTRRIEPSIESIWPDGPVSTGIQRPLQDLAFAQHQDSLLVAARTEQQLVLLSVEKLVNMLTNVAETKVSRTAIALDYKASASAMDGAQRWLYVGGDDGVVRVYTLPGLQLQHQVSVGSEPITAMSMLLGGTSLLAGDAAGAITQLFPVRTASSEWVLTPVRTLTAHTAPIIQIIPEQRRRGFMALDAAGHFGIHHSTAQRTIAVSPHGLNANAQLALSPRANAALLLDSDGALLRLDIDNPHPEVSMATLWKKVWYENYSEPRQTWQSTAATNDFEPKFSLAPLAFGTLKAAFYAMAFAVPLALLGAMYSAVFMAPSLRKTIKPTIELMAALPTVILGFLAGLWLAPFIEQNLAALLIMVMLIPVGLFVFAYLWHRLPARFTDWLRDGWEPVLLLPVLVVFVYLAVLGADPVQNIWFEGSLSAWLAERMGIAYDQRNAVIVGIAMGFSVIPTIFSIAEDALFEVPRSLSNGSLALGATRWQTLLKVILPTASPGIFSGLMIGMGRAVGETMIVLMATGNTPIMDWSLFEGMRTLAANIAIEMPESEVQSTHFRILFLSALVLFVFTFVVNTGAELIRQRLRARYSAL